MINNSEVFIWCINYSAEDACPYSSGVLAFATFVKDNKVIASYQIGEQSGSADAPAWSDIYVSGQIDMNGNFKVREFVETGDEDENGEEKIDKTDNM